MAREFLIEIGEKIRVARKEKRMSQQELARLANCSPQLVSKIEKGQVDTTVSTLLTIQRAVGIEGGVRSDGFFRELIEWAKEISGSDNIEWMKRQIEAQFPAFKKWKEEKEGKETERKNPPISKVA